MEYCTSWVVAETPVLIYLRHLETRKGVKDGSHTKSCSLLARQIRPLVPLGDRRRTGRSRPDRGGGGVAFAAPGPIVITLAGDSAARADATITVDGLPYTAGTEIRDTVFPTQHCVRVSGPGVYVHHWNAQGGFCRFQQTNDVFWVMGSADADVTVTHTATVTKNVRHVAPGGRDAEDAGLTADDPYKTLNYAASQAPGICVILCAEGDYDEGEYVNGTERSRVYDYAKQLLFRGAGIGRSVLWGALDETDPSDGRGPNAVRCAFFDSSARSAIQGFTVRDGRCVSTGTESASTARGGGGYNVNFVDCLITNCAAFRGQVVYHGSLTRCLVAGNAVANTASGRLFEGSCTITSSALLESAVAGVRPALTTEAPLFHCTVYPATGVTANALVADPCVFTNCVSSATGDFGQSVRTWSAGCVWKWFRTNFNVEKQIVADCTDADPDVVDWAGHDIRLKAQSPAIGAGVLTDDYYRFYCSDLNGQPIVFRNGRPTAGAVQEVVACVRVTAEADFGTVEPTGDTVLEPGESVTVTVKRATRPVAGFTVNGAFVAGRSYTYTAPAAGVVPEPVIVSAVVSGTNWYVNAQAAASGDGFSSASAKKTLAEALAGDVRAGDVIRVAEGDYDAGEMFQPSAADTIRCRVAIPAGVSLVAEGRASATRIVGASATVEEDAANYPGCGADAMRCVWMGAGARLRGFTLTGGRTAAASVEDGSDKSSSRETCYGGAVLAKSGAVIEDCIITNAVSRRGSAATGGGFRRCTFVDIGGAHSALMTWTAQGYVVDGLESCSLDLFDMPLDMGAPIVNCLVGSRKANGAERTYGIYARPGQVVRNTICLAYVRTSTAEAYVFTNVVCQGFGGTGVPSVVGFGGVWPVATLKAGLHEAGGLYTGLSGRDSVFVDAGGAEAWDLVGATDLAGVPRILNGALDVGPWEHDWRGDYARALGGKGTAVSSASARVTLNAQGKVRLTDGETLACTVTDTRKTKVRFAVSDGTLTVTVNGVARTFTADGELTFETCPATLTFAFAGTGSADLLGLKSELGFLFILK